MPSSFLLHDTTHPTCSSLVATKDENKEGLTTHMPYARRMPNYCPCCGRGFHTTGAAYLHVRNAHPETALHIVCPYCQEEEWSTSKPRAAERHLRRVHGHHLVEARRIVAKVWSVRNLLNGGHAPHRLRCRSVSESSESSVTPSLAGSCSDDEKIVNSMAKEDEFNAPSSSENPRVQFEQIGTSIKQAVASPSMTTYSTVKVASVKADAPQFSKKPMPKTNPSLFGTDVPKVEQRPVVTSSSRRKANVAALVRMEEEEEELLTESPSASLQVSDQIRLMRKYNSNVHHDYRKEWLPAEAAEACRAAALLNEGCSMNEPSSLKAAGHFVEDEQRSGKLEEVIRRAQRHIPLNHSDHVESIHRDYVYSCSNSDFRLVHAIQEKSRRADLTNRLRELRASLPASTSERLSQKSTSDRGGRRRMPISRILSSACDFIHQLTREVDSIQREITTQRALRLELLHRRRRLIQRRKAYGHLNFLDEDADAASSI